MIKKKYLDLWESAKPYYKTARACDIPQIEWMLHIALGIIKKENLDEGVFIPLILLHDIGYTDIENKNPNVKDPNIKKKHMKKGAEIATKLLSDIDLLGQKKKEVVKLISVHDNWVFEDNEPYKKSKELAVFTDLDFMYPIIDYDVFKGRAEGLGEEIKQSFQNFITDEKLTNRPLCCQSTIDLWQKLTENFEKELNERD